MLNHLRHPTVHIMGLTPPTYKTFCRLTIDLRGVRLLSDAQTELVSTPTVKRVDTRTGVQG